MSDDCSDVAVWMFYGVSLSDDTTVRRTALRWSARDESLSIPVHQQYVAASDREVDKSREVLKSSEGAWGLSEKRRQKMLDLLDNHSQEMRADDDFNVYRPRVNVLVDWTSTAQEQGIVDGEVLIVLRDHSYLDSTAVAAQTELDRVIDPSVMAAGPTTWGKVKEAMADRENATNNVSINAPGSSGPITVVNDNPGIINTITGTVEQLSTTIEGSTAASAELRTTLSDLTLAVQQMIATSTAGTVTAEKVEHDLKGLVEQAVRDNPNRRIWEVSAEGLREAAKALGEIGAPVLSLIATVVGFLG